MVLGQPCNALSPLHLALPAKCQGGQISFGGQGGQTSDLKLQCYRFPQTLTGNKLCLWKMLIKWPDWLLGNTFMEVWSSYNWYTARLSPVSWVDEFHGILEGIAGTRKGLEIRLKARGGRLGCSQTNRHHQVWFWAPVIYFIWISLLMLYIIQHIREYTVFVNLWALNIYRVCVYVCV